MKELKFRQRNKNNGQWFYWGFIVGKWVNPKQQDNYVNPEKSDRFTGLPDKNGKEIYEGDILSYPKHKGYYLMKWICDGAKEGSDCGFTCERDKPSYNYMLPSVWKKMEIIGNIDENPELLKGV